jgi:hypothetical protein
MYGALAYGRSVREAFDLGVAALDSHQRELPQLFTRPGVDANRVYLVECRRFRTLQVGLAALLACAMLVAGWRWLAPASAASREAPSGTQGMATPGTAETVSPIAPLSWKAGCDCAGRGMDSRSRSTMCAAVRS